jgi:hypothetical protein
MHALLSELAESESRGWASFFVQKVAALEKRRIRHRSKARFAQEAAEVVL